MSLSEDTVGLSSTAPVAHVRQSGSLGSEWISVERLVEGSEQIRDVKECERLHDADPHRASEHSPDCGDHVPCLLDRGECLPGGGEQRLAGVG